MRYPLRYVIPAMLLVVGLFAAAAVAWTSVRLSNASTESLVVQLMTTVGNQAAGDVAAGLRRDNDARVRNAIEQLQVMRGLRRALLVDANNQVQQASAKEERGLAIDGMTEPIVSALLDEVRASAGHAHRVVGNQLYYADYVADARPLLFGGGNSGYSLVMVYDLTTTKAGQNTAALNQALIIGLTVLGLSLATWLFLNNALFGRMTGLVEASRRIGEGELRTPIRVTGNDEIATLGRALDHMRIELSEKQSELRHVAEDLEAANAAVEHERAKLADRVALRTRDLTRANKALAEAKDEAEAASRAKSAFLATVSHEIRTPMNGVLGAMELLERSGLEGNKLSLLRTAQQSARSLLALLNDLLDMAKIEAGRIEIDAAPASLESLVDRVVATFTPSAAARRTRISSIVDDDAPAWVITDAFRVQQILGNFVSNAVKFTENGHIELRVTVEQQGAGDCVLNFSVSDTGCGIEPDALDKLFQPFEQGAVEIARRSGGTGLGLAICRGLAERLGGRVRLESSPGRGTTASFELPVKIGDAPRRATGGRERRGNEAVTALLERRAKDVLILVVDDHPVNRLLQVRQVEQLGARADTAGDGIQALEKLAAREFDVVITDCEMPRMDGFELARAIRESDADFRSVPIIACTAHALPDIDERCAEAGMNEVLTKPMRLAELADSLARYWPDDGPAPTLPQAAPPTVAEVLDEDALDLLTGGDPELRSNMLQAFARDNRKALGDIRLAVDGGDLDQCREIAHRNKGSSVIFGAVALGDAFAAVESLAESERAKLADVAAAVERLGNECERFEEQLAASACAS